MNRAASASPFNPAWIIQKKRDGGELSPEEIRAFIRGSLDGTVADYQTSAWLMSVFFRDMSLDETVALTQAMLESGERYDFSQVPGVKADKHSTGGVGDKVSLILAPLAAACGLKVPMMAGRGLGHSGGTIDKLEAIPGFQVKLPRARVTELLRDHGVALMGQSDTIAPADKKLYALRDVTATVECIPLIVASILSKKIAEGAEVLVFDVKVGNGAFMPTKEKARRLAQTLARVAKKMGLRVRSVLTDMNQPLGYAVGNAIEIKECIQVLRNQKDPELNSMDLKEVTIQLGAHMLDLAGVTKNLAEARKLCLAKLQDGSAWDVFQRMVRAQGGDLKSVLEPARLAQAPRTLAWKASRKGYVSRIDTRNIGRILVELGGGRKQTADVLDLGVGMIFHRKLGAAVKPGELIATVHAPERLAAGQLAALEELFHDSVEISAARKPVPKLVIEQY